MSRFRHLIFDLDGTLVDTKADLAAATNAMLTTLGLPTLSLQQVTAYIGLGARVLVERALGTSRGDLVARGFKLFMAYYQAHLLDHTRPYPGIEALLLAARAQGRMLSVLTNKPETLSRTILDGLGLSSGFFGIVGGDTLPTKKPNPYGVTFLQQRSGIDLSQTLLIGDSSIDIETGHAAGVSTCGVMWGFGSPELPALCPPFLVETPQQLADLLQLECKFFSQPEPVRARPRTFS